MSLRLLALAFALCPMPAMAGAWTLPPGKSEFWLSTSMAAASSAFGPGHALQNGSEYRKVEQTLLFEHGLTDGLTLVLGTQFLAVTLPGPERAQYAGPGYTDVGARFRLAEAGGWVISTQMVARAPGTGDASSRAVVGYTDWEADLRLLAGTSFTLFGRQAFLDFQVADRLRFGPPPDELRLDATFGIELVPGWQALIQSLNVISLGAGEGPDFDLSYEYYKAQAGFLVAIDPRLSLGAFGFTTYLARNFPQENGVVLAVQYRY
ncbi:hypothetical protein ACLBXM_01460 [Xanthobacteraceae bacterium A53D]